MLLNKCQIYLHKIGEVYTKAAGNKCLIVGFIAS